MNFSLPAIVTKKSVNSTTHKKINRRRSSIVRSLFILCLLSAVTLQNAFSQASINNYLFTTNSLGSLENLSAGSTQYLGPGVFDSGGGDVVPIGFPVIFMGKVYTHFSVNANGQMRLHLAGETPIATGSVTAFAANVNTLALFAGDNEIGEGIRYKIVGSSPNRKLVVEWQEFYVSFTNIDNAGNMQAWIEEGTGKISYVYGEIYNSSSSSQARSIFLASSNTATTAGYITINTPPTEPVFVPAAAVSTNTIAAGSGGTIGAPLIANIGSSAEGSRRVFSWSPTSASGLAAPSGLALSAVTLSSTTLTWNAASPTTGIVSYTVLGSVDGGTTFNFAANVPVGTNTFTATGLTPSTNYTWRVYSNNDGQLSTGFAEESAFTAACAVSGTKSVGPGGNYATLTAALLDIKNNGAAGPVILELNSTYVSTSETFPLLLNAYPCASAVNTVTIRPAAGVTNRVITSSNAVSTVTIEGGKYYIIDGRPGGVGTGKELTISNTSTTAAARSLLFINEASFNIVRYTKFLNTLNAASTTSAIIAFSTTTGSDGNDNNTIDNCDVDGNAGTAASPTAGPQNGIYNSGTALPASNSGNIISNNNIFNIFRPTSLSNGLNLVAGGTDWTITGNSFYQTSPRVVTTGATYCAILINSTVNNNCNISGNFIGGSAPLAAGAPWNMSGTVAIRFRGISTSVGVLTPSVIQNNTITNFSYSTNTSATAAGGPWVGIYHASGNISINGNTIGAATGTGAIALTQVTSAGGISNGIFADPLAANIYQISNNVIGSITLAAGTGSGFTGITATLGNPAISGNIIGSLTTANSIQANTGYTGATAQVITGISVSPAGTVSITGNTIANISNNYLPAAANAATVLRGIWASAGVDSIAGNTVRNLTTAASATGTGVNASVIGIGNTSSTVGVSYINANTIYALSNTNNTINAVQVTGIVSSSAGFVERNLVYSITTPNTTAATIIAGIHAIDKEVTYQNNMVRLGVSNANATPIAGILESGGTNNFWHNTVFIGGSGVATTPGTSSSFAFYNNTDLTTSRSIRNNIFLNERTSSSTGGKHYAIRIGGTAPNPAGLTIDNNIYNSTGAFTGILGYYNGADITSLAAWKSAVGQDVSSLEVNPCLADPTAATPDLHLTDCAAAGSPADGSGALIGVINDFDNQVRDDLTPTDIGADAGNYGLIGVDVGISELVNPAPGVCYSASQTITVALKNYGINTIDFSVNNVTVTVTTTAGYNESLIINTGTLAANATMNISMPLPLDMSGAAIYTFNATAVVAGDINNANNDLPVTNRYVLAGSYTVGTGGNFTTLTEAVEIYNTSCITGAVTFNLTDALYSSAESFPIVINSNIYSSSVNTLTIRPASGAVTIQGTSGTLPASLIKLNGADHVILDGINSGGASLLIENTSVSAGAAVIWLASEGAGAGATNNIIRNVTVKGAAAQNTGAVITYGIVQGGATLATTIVNIAAGNDNDNNTIASNTVLKVRYAIFTRGGTIINPNTGTIINNNIIGPATAGADMIGKGGIVIREEDGIVISGNTIRNVGGIYANTSAGSDRAGIAMGTDVSWTPVAVLVKNATIVNNVIHYIIDERTFSAAGIIVAGTDGVNPTNNFIANNMLSNIRANGTSSDQTIGIGIGSGNGDMVVFNTVYLTGDTDPNASATATALSGFGISITSASNLSVKNNIVFMDLSSSSAPALKNAAINIPSSFVWGTGGSDFNDLYVSSSNAQSNIGAIGGSTGVFYPTFADWKTVSLQDANSKNVIPSFVSATDLHLVPLTNNELNNAGTPVSEITTDIDGNTRNAVNPDMGADEFDPPLGVDMGVSALVSPNANGCYTNAETVTVTVKNYSFNTIDFSTDNITVNVTISNGYNESVILNTGTLAPLASMNVTMPVTTDLSAYGSYTFNASTSYAGTDLIPANDAMAPVIRTSAAPVAGTISVLSPDGAQYCITSGKPKLKISSATGGVIQWQESAVSATGPWTNTGSDSLNYSVTSDIIATSYYRVIVSCGLNADTSDVVSVAYNNPVILTTTPGTRCGTGPVTLSATANAGSVINWYALPSGGVSLATGNSYSPVISSSATFYAAANSGSGANQVSTQGVPNVTTSTQNSGVLFTLNVGVLLNSIDVYSTAAGTATVVLQNNAGTVLYTSSALPISAGTISTPQTLPLGWSIPAGTDYRILVSNTGNALGYHTGAFPADMGNGVGTITTGATATGTTTLNYFVYNMNTTTGCESARTAVEATITEAPAINAAATPDQICQGSSTTLSVTSANSGYSYSWSPATSPSTGASVTATPAATTTYLVSATDTSGGSSNGCLASASVTVTVNPVPANITISPDAVVCPGSSITLTATSTIAGGTQAIGTQTTTLSTTGSPYRSGASAGWVIKTQFLIRASELTALGYSAGNITSIGFDVTTASATTNLLDFSIGMANTAATVLSGTFDASAFTNVFNAATLSPQLGHNSHAFSTPFYWDGVSNVVIQTCQTNSSTLTTTAVAAFPPGFAGTSYAGSATTSCATTAATSTTNRPVITISMSAAANITWSPSTYLNTTTGNTVISTPATGITYTATATLGTCSKTANVSLTISDLAVTAVHTDATCNGAPTGTITATATGGTAPYEYSIDGTTWQSSNIFNGIAAGTYTISVRDNHTPKCIVTGNTVIVGQPSAIALQIDLATDPVCNNGVNGAINASATGGTGTIQFSLDNIIYQSSGSFTGLASGSYTVYAKDANNCVVNTPVTLNNPALPVVGITSNSPICAGTDAVLTATGGYATYLWTGPGTILNSTTQTATAVNPSDGDVYTVTISDANGCSNSATAAITVLNNTSVSVSISAQPGTEVCAQTPVTFTATPVNGGSSPTYQWYLNGIAVTDSTNSTYTSDDFVDGDQIYVIMNSSLGCTTGSPATSNTETIVITGLIFASVDNFVASQNNICSGTNVTFTVSATGGGASPLYDFYVNDILVQSSGSDNYTYAPANGDNVYAIMTSSFACAIGSPATSAVITMAVNTTPPAPVITAGGPVTFCAGGSVTLSSSYSGSGHVWSPGGETTDQITVSASGTYSVIYTSAQGCISSSSIPVEVTVNANPVAVISGILNYCTGNSTTLSAATSTAGSGTITSYEWILNGATTVGTDPTLVTNTAGSYTLTVTNSNTCSNTSAPVVVAEAVPPVAGISASCTNVFPGQSTILTATPSGLAYEWTLNAGPVLSTVNPYTTTGQPGVYEVKVTDANGCSDTETITITAISGALTGGSTYSISTDCNGFATINDAVNYINVNGVTGTGTITFNVAAGHIETAPSAGIILNQCALDPSLRTGASLPVVFQKSGAGANPKITAGAGTGTNDVIFAIAGADYITIDGIDLAANAANTTSTTRTEWGYLLTGCSGTDGAQHNTIKNCTVTLEKANGNTHAGIAILNNAMVVTALSGTNSYNRIYSNTVTNALNGIRLFGYDDTAIPYALYDQENEIGAAGQGNIVTNLGRATSAAQSNGIYAERNNNIKIIGNTVNSTGGATHIGAINGISTAYARWANVEVSGNNVTVISTPAVTSTNGMNGISVTSGSRTWYNRADAPANTIIINNNTVENSSLNGGKGLFRAISFNKFDTLGAHTINITNNRVLNNSSFSDSASAFVFGGIISQPAANVYNVSNNVISGNGWKGTSSVAAHPRMLVLSWGWELPADSWTETKTISGNRVINNTTTSLTGPVTGIVLETITTGTQLPGSKAIITNNYVGDVTLPTTTGLFAGIVTTSAGDIDVNMSFDTVNNVIRNAVTTGAFDGVRATGAARSVIINNSRVTNVSMNSASVTTAVFNGITSTGSTTATDTLAINNNVVSDNIVAGTSGAMNCIDGGTANGSVTMNNNTVTNNRKLSTTTGILDLLVFGGSSTATDSLAMNNNTVTGNIHNGTGITNCIYGGLAVAMTLNNNTVTGNIKTSASGTLYSLRASTSRVTYNNNIINNNGLSNTSGTSAGIVYGIQNSGSPTLENITNNQISNLYVRGTSTSTANIAYGISSNSVAAAVKNISHNTIHSVFMNVAGNVRGIDQSLGTTVNISRNKIYNISDSSKNATVTVEGIRINSGSANVFNNIIGDLRADSTTSSDAVRGIASTSATASSTLNIYYNTIRIAGTSFGTNFGTSGIFHTFNTTATTAQLTMRNNIIVNNSVPTGTGRAVAFRRSASTNLNNYTDLSDNNLFYAGTPSAAHLIYFDGTNADQTLADFKVRVAPREQLSVTENPPFISVSGASPDFLHIDPVVPTQVEGGAENIAGITNDFDGDIRQGNPGYTGTSLTKPDIGADETNATPPPCVGAAGGVAAISNVTACTINTAVTFSPAGYSTGGGITYQWKVSGTSGTGYTNVSGGSGANTPVYTTPADLAVGTYYYILEVTCATGPVTGFSNEDTLIVNLSPTASASNNGPVCSGTQITLTGVSDLGTSFSWSGPGGFTSVQQSPTFTAPAGGTGNYTFSATLGGCTTTATTAVLINATPVIVINPASATICEGNSIVLSATGSSNGSETIGTQSSTIGGNTGNPYRAGYGVNSFSKNQVLILASELSAAGFGPGSISSLGFTTTGIAATAVLSDFTIHLANTSATVLGSTFVAPIGTNVFTQPTFTPVLGLNMHDFQTPFFWDGSSNLLVTVCQQQTGPSVTVTVATSATPAIANIQAVGASINCNSSSTGASTATTRPITTIAFTAPPANVTWSPSAGLNTTTGESVTATPAISTIYTATADNAGCIGTSTSNITVTVKPDNVSISGTATVCRNAASPVITFTAATGTAPYTFSYNINGGPVQQAISSAGANPVSVTIPAPTGTAGTFTYNLVSVTDVNCTNPVTGSAAITVLELPVVSFTGLDASYCLASSASTLTSNQTSGTFSGPGVINNGDGTASFVASSAGPGTHTITFTYSDGTCSNSITQNTTVNPDATAGIISGPLFICTGSTAAYASSGNAGGTWSSSDDLVATVNASTGVVTAVSAGTAGIIYTVSTGCNSPVSSSITITVTANGNAGTITGTSPMCAGTSATFTSNGNSGGIWSTSNALVANVDPATGMVSAIASGSAVITYTVSECGPVSTSTFNVTVNAAPNAVIAYGGSPYCSNGETASPALTGTTGGTYSSTAGLSINAITGIVDLPASLTGTYVVTYTIAASGGCPVYTTTASIEINEAPSVPSIISVNNGDGTYTLTATAYTGTLLWSTAETTESITISSPGVYTVTATAGGCTSNPATFTLSGAITADPAVSSLYITDLADNNVNPNTLGTGTYNLNVPVLNLNQLNFTPAGTTRLVIDLGTKMTLSGPLSTPLSAYFTWTSAVVGGHLIITGDQTGSIPADFFGNAVFAIEGSGSCISSITANWVVDNHAGGYTLTDEDAGNNFASLQYGIPVTINATANNVTCFGAANGTISWVASPGTSIVITNASNQIVTAPFGPGTYTVTATGFNDNPPGGICSSSTTVTITEPATAVTATSTGTNATCFTAASGTATAQGAGGTGPYSYSWNTTPVQTTQTATGLTAGTYTATVTDANGCTAFTSVTITQPTSLTATATGTNNSCFGGSTGTATVVASNGTAPYNYSWNTVPEQTTATATGLAAGTYIVTVTDAGGCSVQASYTVTQPAAGVMVATSGTAVSCFGGSNGTATATATGGTAPYNYSWNTTPVQTTAIATGLAAGTYTVTVTDAGGCSASATFEVLEPAAALAATTTTTAANCFGQSNGTATANVTGGTGAYSYSWNTTPVQTTATATGLAAGNYTVTVTDANGCTTTQSATVAQPALLTSTGSFTNVTCNGSANGTATVVPSGGTAPYGYSWNTTPVQTTATATGLAAGSYTVTITDANGCARQQTFTITQPAVLTSTEVINNVSCNGGTNGSATVNVTGGTAPYGYSWNTTPVQTTATASGLGAGSYTVTVTDANGCILTATYNITEPAALAATGSGTNINCFGGTTGTATVAVTGGTAPYGYSWNTTPAQTTQTATGLAAGTYTVTVTDANGCTTSASYIVTQPATGMELTTSQVNVACFGSSNGTATVTATGGTAPYGYSWNTTPAQSTQTATGLAPGTYTVTVTDAAGCVQTASVVITGPASGLTASATGTNVVCFGADNGTATAVPAGGTAPYGYSWNTTPVQTTQTATGLAPGVYTVTITDAGGCTATASYTVTQPATALAISTSNVINNTCHNGNAGSVTGTATGGTTAYAYTISGPVNTTGATSGIFTGLVAGTYTITVTDAGGCAVSAAPVTITHPTGTVPDISLGSDYTANFFGTNGVTQTLLFNVAEIGGNPAVGDTIRLIKQAGYTFTFNNAATATTIGSTNYTLDNTNWKIDNTNPAFVSLIYDPLHNSTPGVLNCGTLVRITVDMTRNTPNIATFSLSARLRRCGTTPANQETNLNNNLNSIIFTAE